MMAWTNRIDPRDDSELFGRVQAAEAVWREVVGPTVDHVDSAWSLATEEGPAGPRRVVWLRLNDRIEGSTIPDERFARWEFEDRPHLYDRFNRIWGKLLQDRSHIQLDRLNGLIKSLPGE